MREHTHRKVSLDRAVASASNERNDGGEIRAGSTRARDQRRRRCVQLVLLHPILLFFLFPTNECPSLFNPANSSVSVLAPRYDSSLLLLLHSLSHFCLLLLASGDRYGIRRQESWHRSAGPLNVKSPVPSRPVFPGSSHSLGHPSVCHSTEKGRF